MKRSTTAMARRVDDEMVILDVMSGRYFGLNEVGALIWDRLGAECTRDELVEAVTTAYDVDRNQASSDVDDLIDQLTDRSLISH